MIIVYESKTGFTQKYAKLLSAKTGMRAVSVGALSSADKGEEIIFLGWMMAGTIKGLRKVKSCNVKAVCASGTAKDAEPDAETVMQRNGIAGLPFFYLRGGCKPLREIKGFDKVILSMFVKMLKKRKEQDAALREYIGIIENGFDGVSAENLRPVIQWIEGHHLPMENESNEEFTDMHMRPETRSDYEAVERLTYEAFSNIQKPGRGGTDEHLLVHKMRSVPAFIPELSFVYELEGRIVGHIAYTQSSVVREDGTAYETITFGPVSVLPEYQKKGIGAALIRHTLEKAKSLGYKAVLITGHPEYYPKFGFVNAERFGITMPDGTSMDAFMALPLVDGALDGISGKWTYDPVFEINRNELVKFNEEFGYARQGQRS